MSDTQIPEQIKKKIHNVDLSISFSQYRQHAVIELTGFIETNGINSMLFLMELRTIIEKYQNKGPIK